jgi:tRNA G18 (ribose-2'-O)-methylase SpoU
MKSSHLLNTQPNELLDILRNLRHSPERPLQLGWAVAEGHTAVLNLLSSHQPIGGIVSAGATPVHDEHIDVHLQPDELTELLGFELRSPVIAIAPALDIDLMRVRFPAIALDGVNDAVNMGAIVRTAAALGIASVVRCQRSANPYVRRAVRTSMGMCFRINTAVADSLAGWLAACRAEERVVVGLETVAESRDIRLCPSADVVVVGNEGQGLSPKVLATCSAVANVPMALQPASLNVSNAAALGMWELCARHGPIIEQ